MHTCTHTNTCTHANTRAHTNTCTHMYTVHTHKGVHTHAHSARAHTCARTQCTHTQTRAHTRTQCTHTDVHTHTTACTHTCTHTQERSPPWLYSASPQNFAVENSKRLLPSDSVAQGFGNSDSGLIPSLRKDVRQACVIGRCHRGGRVCSLSAGSTAAGRGCSSLPRGCSTERLTTWQPASPGVRDPRWKKVETTVSFVT